MKEPLLCFVQYCSLPSIQSSDSSNKTDEWSLFISDLARGKCGNLNLLVSLFQGVTE